MSVRIPNAGQQNLSAIVTQLGDTKGSKQLRSGPNENTGVVELYVKTKVSTGFFAFKEKRIERATAQQNARVDILKALHKEFPQAVADKVLTNMKSFFSGTGKVTAADARAVLANANARIAEVGNSKTLASQAVIGMVKDPLALVELLRLQPAGSPMLAVLHADISGVKELHNFIVKFDAAMAQSTPANKNTALRNLYETAVKQAAYSSASSSGNPFELNLTGDVTGKQTLRDCDNAHAQGTDMTQAMQSVKDYLVTTTGGIDSGAQSPIRQFAAALAASPLLED